MGSGWEPSAKFLHVDPATGLILASTKTLLHFTKTFKAELFHVAMLYGCYCHVYLLAVNKQVVEISAIALCLQFILPEKISHQPICDIN